MRKTAIALAVASAAAVSTANAQNILIDGYFDRAYTVTNSSAPARDIANLASSAGTTFIGFSGSEDLGGGLRASFRVNTDFADMAGLFPDGSGISSTNAQAAAFQTGGFANSQSWLQLAIAGVGDIRLGTVNNQMLTLVSSVASPALSTGVGSIYSTAFSVLEGVGTGISGVAGAPIETAKSSTIRAYAGARPIRQRDSIYYFSPNVNGFQFSAGYVPQTDRGSSNDNVGVSEYSLRYTNGPLDIMAGTISYDVGSNPPNNVVATTGSTALTANTSYTHNALGATFAINPALRIHGGTYTSKSKGLSSSATQFNSRANSLGLSYNVTPAISAMFNVAQVNDVTSLNMDRSLTGVGLNYSLSKRTRAYVRYDNIVTDKSQETAAGNKLNRTAVGLSHTF